MRLLQHFTDPAQPPIGVWWENKDGEAESVYLSDAQAEQAHASHVMALKYPKATWDQFFDALEQIPPVISGWESVESSMTPQAYLQLTQKLTKQVA
jgi:hypothetical protein